MGNFLRGTNEKKFIDDLKLIATVVTGFWIVKKIIKNKKNKNGE